MLRRLIAVFVTVAIVLGAGWFVMRRSDIGYDRLESMYANTDSRFMPMGGDMRVHYRDVGPRNAAELPNGQLGDVHGTTPLSAVQHTVESARPRPATIRV